MLGQGEQGEGGKGEGVPAFNQDVRRSPEGGGGEVSVNASSQLKQEWEGDRGWATFSAFCRLKPPNPSLHGCRSAVPGHMSRPGTQPAAGPHPPLTLRARWLRPQFTQWSHLQPPRS